MNVKLKSPLPKRHRLPVLTFLLADHGDGTGQLQAGVSVDVEGSGRTLDTGACLEVDGVQGDGLGVVRVKCT